MKKIVTVLPKLIRVPPMVGASLVEKQCINFITTMEQTLWEANYRLDTKEFLEL
jgi:hypothetical protein